MAEERRRIRKRKISEPIKPEEQKPRLKVEESSAEGRTKGEKRKKTIRELIKPEGQKPVLPVEESSAEERANESRRSRRISSSLEPEEPKASLTVEEGSSKTETEKITNQANLKDIQVMRRDVDEIKAELVEEKQSALLESDYWDETHSWGSDGEEASDEYWHFVGRYE